MQNSEPNTAVDSAELQPLAVVAPFAEDELMTVEEAKRCLKIGHTLMYALIGSGAVESVKIGKARRIKAKSVKRIAQYGT